MIDWGLVSCGLRGHITYRPDESEYADRLRATTVAGEAWRCLRCGERWRGEQADEQAEGQDERGTNRNHCAGT